MEPLVAVFAHEESPFLQGVYVAFRHFTDLIERIDYAEFAVPAMEPGRTVVAFGAKSRAQANGVPPKDLLRPHLVSEFEARLVWEHVRGKVGSMTSAIRHWALTHEQDVEAGYRYAMRTMLGAEGSKKVSFARQEEVNPFNHAKIQFLYRLEAAMAVLAEKGAEAFEEALAEGQALHAFKDAPKVRQLRPDGA